MVIEDVWNALRQVRDPEIPTISLVDLGVITDVHLAPDGAVTVTMTPTFVGCPAIEYMRREVEERVRALGAERVTVTVSLDIPWSSNRLTEQGRASLLAHGLAPPETYESVVRLEVLNETRCPFCGSRDTELRSPFGATLCRSLHYCRACRQAFEGFKPV